MQGKSFAMTVTSERAQVRDTARLPAHRGGWHIAAASHRDCSASRGIGHEIAPQHMHHALRIAQYHQE